MPKYVINNTEDNNKDVRQSIIDWAEEQYGVTVNTHSGSYKLREVTMTTITVEERNEQERDEYFTSTMESTQSTIFHTSFRTEAQTEEFYRIPWREAERSLAQRREAEKLRNLTPPIPRITEESASSRFLNRFINRHS